MAQQVKRQLCKPDALSLIPRNHISSHEVEGVCNSGTLTVRWDVETGALPGNSPASQSGKCSEDKMPCFPRVDSERGLLKVAFDLHTPWQMCTCAYAHTHIN